MDLIPKPDQVVSAAANVAHKMLYGGLADLRPMPRTLIDEGVLREVYHYRPRASAREHGDPVLLVTPLAAPAICFDLRRGCSLVEHLVDAGRPTYLVEYGEVSFANRGLGMEHWVDEVVPQAIAEVSRHAGGRPVHVVGWSLGAIFALLTAADRPDLPIASLTSVGAPVDVTQVPLVAPIRPFLGLAGERAGLVTQAYRLIGGLPKPLVRRAFQLSSFNKLVTKPIAIAAKLDDADFLAQVEAVDRFTANMIAYPGRTFGQLYHRLLKGNQLAGGTVTMDDRDDPPGRHHRAAAGVRRGRRRDRPGAVRAADRRPGHRRRRPALRGRARRPPRDADRPGGASTTWRIIDEWITGTPRRRPRSRRPRPARRSASAKQDRAPATKRGGPPRASKSAIGANPRRRYGSAGSRTLAAKKSSAVSAARRRRTVAPTGGSRSSSSRCWRSRWRRRAARTARRRAREVGRPSARSSSSRSCRWSSPPPSRRVAVDGVRAADVRGRHRTSTAGSACPGRQLAVGGPGDRLRDRPGARPDLRVGRGAVQRCRHHPDRRDRRRQHDDRGDADRTAGLRRARGPASAPTKRGSRSG